MMQKNMILKVLSHLCHIVQLNDDLSVFKTLKKPYDDALIKWPKKKLKEEFAEKACSHQTYLNSRKKTELRYQEWFLEDKNVTK